MTSVETGEHVAYFQSASKHNKQLCSAIKFVITDGLLNTGSCELRRRFNHWEAVKVGNNKMQLIPSIFTLC